MTASSIESRVAPFYLKVKEALSLGDASLTGKRFLDLGLAYSVFGEHLSAYEAQKECIRFARTANDTRTECAGLNNLGLACGNLGRYDEAERNFEASLRLTRADDKVQESKVLGGLGFLYRARGDLTQAVELLRRSVELSRNEEVQETLGDTYLKLGRVKEALEGLSSKN